MISDFIYLITLVTLTYVWVVVMEEFPHLEDRVLFIEFCILALAACFIISCIIDALHDQEQQTRRPGMRVPRVAFPPDQ